MSKMRPGGRLPGKGTSSYAVYYKWLEQLQHLCGIGGQYMIVVNMQPTAAYGLATFLKDPPAFACARDVHHARAVFAELD